VSLRRKRFPSLSARQLHSSDRRRVFSDLDRTHRAQQLAQQPQTRAGVSPPLPDLFAFDIQCEEPCLRATFDVADEPGELTRGGQVRRAGLAALSVCVCRFQQQHVLNDLR
jgi:hypothetical protein